MELTSFWKLVSWSNSLRLHFLDIDWHLFVVVEVMDCRCQAAQVWWRKRSPKGKTTQRSLRPSYCPCHKAFLADFRKFFFFWTLHFLCHSSKYQYFSFYAVLNVTWSSNLFPTLLELVFVRFFRFCLHRWCSFMHCAHFSLLLSFTSSYSLQWPVGSKHEHFKFTLPLLYVCIMDAARKRTRNCVKKPSARVSRGQTNTQRPILIIQ